LETPYVNGKRHGIEKSYYESNALEWEAPYVNGKMHGVLKRYYDSGALKYESPYENGRRHGIKKFYNNDKASIEYLVLYKENWKVCSIEI
jgi:antitoxin component YwqK of YwqJK toxin-antitoxin module